MYKWEEIVDIAESDIGKSRDEVGCSGNYAWCADWASSVLARADIGEDVRSRSCTKMQMNMKKNTIDWYEPIGFPTAGDYMFFDWDHKDEELPLDHVGIVLDFDEDTLQVTYANGNGSSPHYVTKQYINLNATDDKGRKLVAYWMRYVRDMPANSEEPEETTEPDTKPETPAEKTEKEVIITARQLKRGMSGGDVKSLQRLLFADGYSVGQCGDDGEFGPDTEKAVKNYQEDHDLDPDGIAGVLTLNALWRCEKASRD